MYLQYTIIQICIILSLVLAKMHNNHYINKVDINFYDIDECDYLVMRWAAAPRLFEKEIFAFTRYEDFEGLPVSIPGKCADYLLRERDNVASFYVEAPRWYCLESVMRKTGVNEKEAAKLIARTDRYRADYYHFYSGGNYWTNPVNYDLTLNSARLGREQCPAVMIECMKLKFGADFVEAFKDRL